MRVFFAFPGQGAQRPGILHGLNTFGLSVIEEMSNAIGLDLLTLDSAEAFERTENVQLALLCAGIGKCRELEAAGIQPSLVAGLSIGAFGAAVAAHALSLTDAARLVLLRGRLMQGAYPSGYGMMAIGGLNLNTAEDITNAVDDIYVSNINSEQQIVLSGPLSSLDIARTIIVFGHCGKACKGPRRPLRKAHSSYCSFPLPASHVSSQGINGSIPKS